MPSQKIKFAAGLDVGRSSTKYVVLQRRADGQINVLHAAVFDHRAEGIVSEEELPEPLGEWIRASGHGKIPLVIGIPQHSAIIQLSDFPPGEDRQLNEMVDYETRQLGGLSDDEFLHDHAPLGPFHIYQNPVLIGICRETLVRERLEQLTPTEAPISDVAMEGAALAMAVQQLQQRQVVMPRKLDLILDLGADGGNILLQTEGRVVFSATIPIGGSRFTTALATIENISEAEAELRKREISIDTQQPGPLTDVANQLVREIQQAINHWRFQREENDLPLNQIFLTGAAHMRGLDLILERELHCQTARLAMPDAPEGMGSALLTAWGLALHGLNEGNNPYRLSLAPPELKYLRQRLARTPYLAIAATLLLLASGLSMTTHVLDLQRKMKQLQVEQSRLRQCTNLSPKLELARSESRQIEEMLIPFVAFGNRNRSFLTAMKTLGPHQQKGDWLAYLADEPSYLAPDIDYKSSPTLQNVSPSATFLLGLPGSPGAKTGPPHMLTTSIRTSRFFIAAGFTPRFKSEPLQNVRRTIDTVNTLANSPFATVSVLPDVERQVRVAIRPWVEEFQMKTFFIMLPRSTPEYDAGQF